MEQNSESLNNDGSNAVFETENKNQQSNNKVLMDQTQGGKPPNKYIYIHQINFNKVIKFTFKSRLCSIYKSKCFCTTLTYVWNLSIFFSK